MTARSSLTGFKGGALKQFVLNDLLLDAIGFINGRSIIELGAGNGYFLPLTCRRYSGQRPQRLVITDCSERQLELAQRYCRVNDAEYLKLDVRGDFPFSLATFDLVIATMVFNEVSERGVTSALVECHRILADNGQLLMTVLHPDFVSSLERRGELRRERGGVLSIPGSGGCRLPVRWTSQKRYEKCLYDSGFQFSLQEVRANEAVLKARPRLRSASNSPMALLFVCRKIHRNTQ